MAKEYASNVVNKGRSMVTVTSWLMHSYRPVISATILYSISGRKTIHDRKKESFAPFTDED
jgi:hypothetical protein